MPLQPNSTGAVVPVTGGGEQWSLYHSYSTVQLIEKHTWSLCTALRFTDGGGNPEAVNGSHWQPFEGTHLKKNHFSCLRKAIFVFDYLSGKMLTEKCVNM